jgi:hypothetical protein
MSWHGNKWWFTFHDLEGKVQYRNSGTDDSAVAQRLLAQAALPRARAVVEILERIADGKETYRRTEAASGAKGKQSAHAGAQPRAGRRSVRKNSAGNAVGKGKAGAARKGGRK